VTYIYVYRIRYWVGKKKGKKKKKKNYFFFSFFKKNGDFTDVG
jgi:hypothetical protein